VPDPESRRRLHEENPRAFPEGGWRTGDNINLAIGQGELVVTPLQLANAYATFANGGNLYQPRTAARVLDRKGREVTTIDAPPPQHVQLPAAAVGPILAGLRGVVMGDGTAAGAFAGFPLTGFPVAGKTGTAQVFGKQDTALFVGFAPADAPRYVVAVVMEESGFGGSAAAPVARRILQGLAGSPPGPVTLAGSVD
jgi:penicillin-binding protein 2